MIRPLRAALSSVLVLLLSASAGHAATLLPGDFLVSSDLGLLVIDLERGREEIVSSESVGGGVPWNGLRSFDLADDGMVYAATLGSFSQAAIVRIDPESGDRALVSSNARGDGIPLAQPKSVLAARDGSLYVADVLPNDGRTTARIFRIDRQTGDRVQVAETLEGEGWLVRDMEELPDGRLLIVTGVLRLGPSARIVIWILDPTVGVIEQVPRRFGFEGTLPVIARGSTLERMRLIEDGGDFYRIIDPFDPDSSFPRVLAGCAIGSPDFSRKPQDLAFDARGSLIATASSGVLGCVGSALGNGQGQIYRIHPDSGAVELIFDSEGRAVDGIYLGLVIVPEDFPFDDADGDEVADAIDNCPLEPNPDQADLDGDGEGDACNPANDRDGDEFADRLDTCVDVFDPLQLDFDADGLGDACDPFPDDANNVAAALRVELAEVRAELAICRADSPMDEDGDGVFEPGDRCPDTALGAEVDGRGCAIDQFCALFALEGRRERWRCALADWRPEAGGRVRDCRPRARGCIPR